MATHKPNSRLGIVMPVEFNSAIYENIYARVETHRRSFPNEYSYFAGGFRAVAYRFRSCEGHSATFTNSVRQFGDAPGPEEMYVQERELFCFFVAGLAVVESFCYGLFALAAIADKLKPPSATVTNFLMATDKEKRAIIPGKTRDQLISYFSTEDITLELDKLLGYPTHNPPVAGDPGYEAWVNIRNVLAHRTSPGRIAYMSNVRTAKPAEWKEFQIVIDDETTVSRYKWLSETLETLLVAADKFSAKYL